MLEPDQTIEVTDRQAAALAHSPILVVTADESEVPQPRHVAARRTTAMRGSQLIELNVAAQVEARKANQ